jgi:hypothetical protein
LLLYGLGNPALAAFFPYNDDRAIHVVKVIPRAVLIFSLSTYNRPAPELKIDA